MTSRRMQLMRYCIGSVGEDLQACTLLPTRIQASQGLAVHGQPALA